MRGSGGTSTSTRATRYSTVVCGTTNHRSIAVEIDDHLDDLDDRKKWQGVQYPWYEYSTYIYRILRTMFSYSYSYFHMSSGLPAARLLPHRPHRIYGIALLVPTTYYLLLPNTYYQATTYSTTSCLLPTAYYLLHTKYYLLPTTNYLLPATYYLLPTTYYLPATCYLIHTTCYLLPTTSYLLQYLLPTVLPTTIPAIPTYEYYILYLQYYLLPTTYYILYYCTYYLLPTTYYLLPSSFNRQTKTPIR